MFGAIANPKKVIIIEKSIATIKELLPLISVINIKYKKTDFIDLLNLYTFEASEFLSAGVYVDINLTSSGDDKTEVCVEIRRKIGAFDKPYEVTAANEHIKVIFELISKLLQMNLQDINELKEKFNNTPVPKKGCMVVLIVILSITLAATVSAAILLH